MRACCLAFLILFAAGVGRAQALVPDERSSAQGEIRLVIPPEGTIQQLTLRDGSCLFGRVGRITGDRFVFRTIGGTSIEAARADVLALRTVRGSLVRGEFWHADPTVSRLLFAPTARTLRRGEAYFGVYEVYAPFVQVGVTDRFSIGAGTPLVLAGGSRPVWITPKAQLYDGARVKLAAGMIHVFGVEDGTGIAYAVGTIGGSDSAMTAGVGYGYSGGRAAPIVMVGGEHRVSRHVKLLTENWIWRRGDGFAGGGVRFLGERLTADVGLIVPLDVGVFVAVPIVNFVWRF